MLLKIAGILVLFFTFPLSAQEESVKDPIEDIDVTDVEDVLNLRFDFSKSSADSVKIILRYTGTVQKSARDSGREVREDMLVDVELKELALPTRNSTHAFPKDLLVKKLKKMVSDKWQSTRDPKFPTAEVVMYEIHGPKLSGVADREQSYFQYFWDNSIVGFRRELKNYTPTYDVKGIHVLGRYNLQRSEWEDVVEDGLLSEESNIGVQTLK